MSDDHSERNSLAGFNNRHSSPVQHRPYKESAIQTVKSSSELNKVSNTQSLIEITKEKTK